MDELASEKPNLKEAEKSRKLLASSGRLLEHVEDAFIMKNNEPRLYPTFDHREIEQGELLGIGTFGVVFEVKDILLLPPNDAPEQAAMLTLQEEDTGGDQDTHRKNSSRNVPTRYDSVMLDQSHYDVREARALMKNNLRRKGRDARYAIKSLKNDLGEVERARGMIDMAIEAKYLSVMWHPNIVKMRGFTSGPALSPNFFILMDRLYDTLSEKLEQWAKEASSHRGFLGLRPKRDEQKELLLERLLVAYDLSAAFRYMHNNKLVYRDIKPENCGFDCRGNIKVYDFGLSKSLCTSLRAKDRHGKTTYGYNLTPRTGSVPYLAPEVVEGKPYDTKCDVFSFSILLWEILSLKQAYSGYSPPEYLDRVVRRKERHMISRKWPQMVRLAMKDAWKHDPQERPTMTSVAQMLRTDLNDYAQSNDPTVLHRTSHMEHLSEESFKT